MSFLKTIIDFILKILGMHDPVIPGNDAIDQQIEENNDKIEEIDNESHDADSLADAINND